MSTSRSCGTCTLCCKVFGVDPLNKPRNTWCEHCDIGKGCRIYEDRPDECRSFECLWLQGPDIIPEEMAPVHTKVILTSHPELPLNVGGKQVLLIQFHEAQPGAAERPIVRRYIELLRSHGMACIVVPPGSGNRTMLLPWIPEDIDA